MTLSKPAVRSDQRIEPSFIRWKRAMPVASEPVGGFSRSPVRPALHILTSPLAAEAMRAMSLLALLLTPVTRLDSWQLARKLAEAINRTTNHFIETSSELLNGRRSFDQQYGQVDPGSAHL